MKLTRIRPIGRYVNTETGRAVNVSLHYLIQGKMANYEAAPVQMRPDTKDAEYNEILQGKKSSRADQEAAIKWAESWVENAKDALTEGQMPIPATSRSFFETARVYFEGLLRAKAWEKK